MRALVKKRFASPPYLKPAGPIYRAKGAIYYPQGYDWGNQRVTSFTAFDALAVADGFGKPYGASKWMKLHLARELKLQARFGDGRTYAGTASKKNAENRYVGREQVVVGELAATWLTQYLSAHHLLTVTNGPV